MKFLKRLATIGFSTPQDPLSDLKLLSTLACVRQHMPTNSTETTTGTLGTQSLSFLNLSEDVFNPFGEACPDPSQPPYSPFAVPLGTTQNFGMISPQGMPASNQTKATKQPPKKLNAHKKAPLPKPINIASQPGHILYQSKEWDKQLDKIIKVGKSTFSQFREDILSLLGDKESCDADELHSKLLTLYNSRQHDDYKFKKIKSFNEKLDLLAPFLSIDSRLGSAQTSSVFYTKKSKPGLCLTDLHYKILKRTAKKTKLIEIQATLNQYAKPSVRAACDQLLIMGLLEKKRSTKERNFYQFSGPASSHFHNSDVAI